MTRLLSARGNTTLHYKNLNLYMTDGFPAHLMDMKFWEIDEGIYYEFLSMLPPLYVPAGFMMSEALCDIPGGGTLRSYYSKVGNQFWHGFCTMAEVRKMHNRMYRVAT